MQAVPTSVQLCCSFPWGLRQLRSYEVAWPNFMPIIDFALLIRSVCLWRLQMVFQCKIFFTGNSYFFGSFIDNSWLHKLQYFCKKFDLHKDSKKTDRQGDQQTMTGLRGCHKKMENFVRLLFLILSQTCLILMKKIDKILCQCFI